MHLAIGTILSIPLPLWDHIPALFDRPVAYFQTAGLMVTLVSIFLFGLFYLGHTFFLRLSIGFEPVHWQVCPRLHSITTELAGIAGIPTPKLEYISSPFLNAFACGLSVNSAHIVVTQGLLDALDDEELKAVIAHEIAHIKNGDMHMMAVANSAIGSIQLINFLNPMKLTFMKGVMDAIPTPILIPILFFIWPIVLILGLLIVFYSCILQFVSLLASSTRYVISSSREYIADAEAVRLTHNPAALVSALSKITGRSHIAEVKGIAANMMIDGPSTGKNASHPPIRTRMDKLIGLSGSMVYGTGTRMDTRGQSLARFGGNAFGYSSSPTGAKPTCFKSGFRPQDIQRPTTKIRDFIPNSPDYSEDTGYRESQYESESIFDRISKGNDAEFGVDRTMRWVFIILLSMLFYSNMQNPKKRERLIKVLTFQEVQPFSTPRVKSEIEPKYDYIAPTLDLTSSDQKNNNPSSSTPRLRLKSQSTD